MKPKAVAIDHRFKSRSEEWRVQNDGGLKGEFDELVVTRKKALVLHAECLNDNAFFIDVAGLLLWVSVGKDGATIVDAEDTRGGDPPVDFLFIRKDGTRAGRRLLKGFGAK